MSKMRKICLGRGELSQGQPFQDDGIHGIVHKFQIWLVSKLSSKPKKNNDAYVREVWILTPFFPCISILLSMWNMRAWPAENI